MTRPSAPERPRYYSVAVTVLAALLGIAGVAAVALGARRIEPAAPPPIPGVDASPRPGLDEPAGDATTAPVTAPEASPTSSPTASPTPGSRSTAAPGVDVASGRTAAAPVPPGTIEQDASAWERVEPLRRSVPVRVRIPAIGVDAGLVRLGLGSDGQMEVPDGPAPVGWYDRSPTPGQNGPSVLAAHVTWNGAQGAFFEVSRLRVGDRVAVTRADGSVARFVVRAVEQYGKASFPTREVYGQTPGPELRLITCAGAFDVDARTYADNVVVYADVLPPTG